MAKKFLSDIELDAGLVDVSGNTGTSGQILSSTGSATSWVAQGDIVSGEADKAKSVVLRVKNSTLSAMTKGQVVCENTSISPPSGNLIEVKLADNNGTGTMPALGILSQDLDASGGANDEGDAIMFGKVSGIDTSAFNVGDEVFVDDTAGGLTATKPTGVKYIQKIGVVIRDHASNGTIEVFGAGRVNDVPTPLYIDHANQRVGIGRETPSVDLHIDNDSSLPELRLSYEPTGGYGGGGNIRIQGGYNDYVSGSIQWYNAQNRDAQLIYTAVTRSMHFYVNERGSSTNGYFRFYNGSTEVAEINPSGVYGNVFYDQGNTAYYLNPASSTTALNTPLGSARVKDVFIGNSTGQISNRVWFDNGSSNQPGLYFEGGQPKFIIYSSVSNIFHDTYHPNADTWTTARTITLGSTGKTVDGSADVSWSLSEIGAASSSHTHDDRYYTETEMQTFFNRGYISAHSSDNVPIGWYTIATNTGNRALGEFQIWDVASSRHQSVLFNASHHYGTDSSNDITVLANSRFSTDVFRYIRIKEYGTYDGAALQVYIDNSTNAVHAAITGANAQESGWVLKDWIADATDPGDLDNYSSFTEKCKVDLDNTRDGGIITTGEVYAGGATTQYRAFHDAYHPNADTWTTARTITIGNTGKSVNGSANVSWSLAEIGAQAALTNPITGTGTTNYLSKFTGSTTLGNSLVYDNGTNVGIGTTSPSAKLHVSSGTANEDCVVIIESDTDNNDENSNPRLELKQDGGAVIGRLGFRDNTNSLELINQHAESLYLGTSNSIDLTILSDGKVGIGTTSPNQKLTIKGTDQYVAAEQTTYAWGGTNTIGVRMGTDATAGLLDFRRWVGSATTHGTALITQVNSDGGYGLDFRVDTKTSNTIATTSRMFLSQSGEVGIGTTSPYTNFEVIGKGSFGSSGASNLGVEISSVSAIPSAQVKGYIAQATSSAGGGNGDLLIASRTSAATNIRFFAGSTSERMRIDSSGNVGIGATSPGQKLHVIGNVAADIFYDRNNTGYFFNGDASKDNVDLTSGGNYAINVLGTISGGHRKHGNLETLEMQWSVGGGTDLNWKKLCDVVINDANYAGWGAEIEITNFSGNFGNATYNGGELFKGALSIYHWGGTGYQPETAHANIPYEMRSHVRWYKINETGQNRYQLQVKSPGNYQQLYVKVKPGIGNQVADIITYANDTNGNTSGGTAYTSVQSSNFNHEFAGGIWTNDGRAIGWKNAYGSPYLQNYYGSITTSTSVYIGGPSGNGQDLYCDDLRSNKVYDRAATNYYFEGGNTGDSIRVAGDVVAYYSSDKRLKDNIKPIENALDKVNAISGVTFEWNEKSHKTTGRKDVGVVAQEVEEVFPEIVETRTNGFKAVDYQKLTAVLIESVKELTAKVEALEAKQCNCK